MELSKEHKKALMHDLAECIKSIDLQERIINKDDKDKRQLAWHEMELFLLQGKKRLIEQSIIDGEIDF